MRNLTLQQKYEAIKMVCTNKENVKDVAKKLKCGKTQIYEALKKKEMVINTVEKGKDVKKKKIRISKHEKLNAAVFEWFCAARAKNLPVSGPMLKATALEIAKKMGVEFSASNGWLDCFKKNMRISFDTVSGESRDVDVDVVNNWKANLAGKIKQYEMKNIANADETGLFFKMLPNKTMHHKGEKCHGGKMSKERVTVLLTVFGDGTIIKPLVIGKSAKPRCFKNLNIDRLPVYYKNNSKAWMTAQIFTEYLRNLNQQMLHQKRKILLFIDNASSHPKIELSNIELVFFPPNCTSALQPLDAGIINCFKVYYRQTMIKKLLALMSVSSTTSSVVAKINVLDAINMLSRAAKKITPDCIKNCFKHCGFPLQTPDLVIVDDNMAELQLLMERLEPSDDFSTNADEYATIDAEASTENNVLDIDTYVHLESEDETIENSDVIEIDETPTLENIYQSIDMLKIYAKINGNNEMFETLENINFEINEDIVKAAAAKRKQTKIDMFFK